MAEFEGGEQELRDLSTWRLSVMFSELPIDQRKLDWPIMDEETSLLFEDENKWLNENLNNIANHLMDIAEVDRHLVDKEVELLDRCESGHMWIRYGMMFMRASAWEAESVGWRWKAEQDYADPVALSEDIVKRKECLHMTSRFRMIGSILSGFRMPMVNEAVMGDLGRAGFDEEARMIYEASRPKPQRGSYGKANPLLN